jgi:hypothetical protein
MDADQRKRVADALIRRAETLMRELATAAEGGDPARVDDLADRVAEVLKSNGFPPQRAAEFRPAVRTIQLNIRQLATETLLAKAEARAREGDEKGRNETLTLAKEHYGKAIRYGAAEDFRSAVERRVQAVLLTTKEGVDDRTKAAARRKLEARDGQSKAPDGREKRRAIRYVAPTLVVAMEGVRYTTINWSTRGLLVGPYHGELGVREGDRVRLEIVSPEAETGGRVLATVVRMVENRRGIAVTFSDICTVILDITHRLKDKGIVPDPE